MTGKIATCLNSELSGGVRGGTPRKKLARLVDALTKIRQIYPQILRKILYFKNVGFYTFAPVTPSKLHSASC